MEPQPPTSFEEGAPSLAEFLQSARATILSEWEDEVRASPKARTLERGALLHGMSELLEYVSRLEEAPSGEEISTQAPARHALERLHQGFELTELLAEYAALRGCIPRVLDARGVRLPGPELARLHQTIDRALGQAVATHAWARERPLQVLGRIAEAALHHQEPEDFLHELLVALVETSATVDSAVLYLLEDGRLHVRASVGLDEALLAQLSTPMGEDFAGSVAASRESLQIPTERVEDPVLSAALHEAGVRRLYGVPLFEAGEVLGVAQIGSRGPSEFSQQDQLLFAERAARTRVEAAQRRYRDVVEGIDIGIAWEADAGTFQPTFVSPRAELLLGYPRQQWLDEPDFWLCHLHPEDREAVRATFTRALAEETDQSVEHRALAREGREVWLHTGVRSGQLRPDGSRVLRGLSVDITRLKEAERALRVRELGQHRLASLGQHALAGAELPTLLKEAAAAMATTFGVELAGVFELLPDARAARLVAGVGWREGLVGQALLEGGPGTQLSHLLATRGTVISEDTRTESRFLYPPLLHRHGVTSGMCVLISSNGGSSPFGLLGVYSQRRRSFSPDDITLLQATAHLLAISLGQQEAVRGVRKSEQLFRLLVEGVRDYALLMLDSSGRVASWNQGAERLLGYRAEEILGQHLERLHTPEDRERGAPFRQLNLAAAEGRSEEETWLVRKDGSRFWGTDLLQALHDETGALVGFAKVARDISERKHAEDAQHFLFHASTRLAESLDYEATLSQVVRLAVPFLGDGCTLDVVEDGQPPWRTAAAHVDPAKARLLSELQRRSPPQAPARKLPARVLRSGCSELRAEVVEADLATFSQEEEVLEILRALGPRSLMVVPLPGREGIRGTLTFLITDSSRRFSSADLALAEELARRAATALDNAALFWRVQEAVRARDEFLSIASHELRTPLTSMHLQMQSLLRTVHQAREAPSRERLESKLEVVDRQERRLAKLVDRLLDISRLTAGRLELELEEVDLAALVRDVAARFEEDFRRAGSPLHVQAEGPVIGLWDRMRLEEVVTNLLSNALKYGGGKPVEVSLEARSDRLLLRVRDQGVGIALEDQERVFERFQRVSDYRQGGLGLGLWIVRRILEAMGGCIHLESRPGAGATFTVELPRG
jgi:PAS domain S-box-containing protein